MSTTGHSSRDHSQDGQPEDGRPTPSQDSSSESGHQIDWGTLVPYFVAFMVILAYLIWMGIEMSIGSTTGGGALVAIFGSILVALMAAAVPIGLRSVRRKP